MSFGLDSSGFALKTLVDILADIQASELSGISAALDVSAESPIGVVNGVIAKELADLWQLAQALYNGMDPDQATGDQLTGLCLITGTKRLGAAKTQAPGCTVVTSGGFAGAAAGGMFASISGNPAAIFTNKVAVASGAATTSVDFEAVDTGPIVCNTSTLTVIATPITGWTSITNPNSSTIGNDGEVDADLRIKRNQELEAAGSSTADAIRSDVLTQMVEPTTTSDTTSCTVLHNDTDATDANGLPPHSIEVIAYQPGSTSGDDGLLAQLILDQKAAGIGTYSGNGTFKTREDSQGNSENVYYTRPTTQAIYVTLTVARDPNITVAPADIKTALINYAMGNPAAGILAAWNPGVEVYALHLITQAFGVNGVLDVSSWAIGTAPGPTLQNNIPITVRQVATLTGANITVNVTP